MARSRSGSLDSLGRRRRRSTAPSSHRRRRSRSVSRSRSRSASRSRRRDRRSRSRSRSPGYRRRRPSYSRSRSRSASRSPVRRRRRRSASRSASRRTQRPSNGDSRRDIEVDVKSKPEKQEEPVNALSHLSEEEQMKMLLGFGDFDSTKGKMVEENAKSAAVGTARHETKREYRQYMNRRGGFNRPLDKN